MTFIHRFIRWINSRNFVTGRRSSSSVSPSIPVSSNSTIKSECSSAAWFSNSNSSTTKQVHFADDCGEALECVHEIPKQATSGKTFYESLEDVYMNEHGYVTGFLKVANLKPGQTPLLKFTKNEWKSHKTVYAQYSTKKPANCIERRKLETEAETGQDDSCDRSHEEMLTYVFYFYVGRRKANQVKLVVLSTLDGAMDQRHDRSYTLHYPRR